MSRDWRLVPESGLLVALAYPDTVVHVYRVTNNTCTRFYSIYLANDHAVV